MGNIMGNVECSITKVVSAKKTLTFLKDKRDLYQNRMEAATNGESFEILPGYSFFSKPSDVPEAPFTWMNTSRGDILLKHKSEVNVAIVSDLPIDRIHKGDDDFEELNTFLLDFCAQKRFDVMFANIFDKFGVEKTKLDSLCNERRVLFKYKKGDDEVNDDEVMINKLNKCYFYDRGAVKCSDKFNKKIQLLDDKFSNDKAESDVQLFFQDSLGLNEISRMVNHCKQYETDFMKCAWGPPMYNERTTHFLDIRDFEAAGLKKKKKKRTNKSTGRRRALLREFLQKL